MRDLRYAIRVLWKSPIFATTAILTLALCIGANTAIYTVVDRVLIHSLWTRVFNADPAVIGRRVTLRGEPYTIVGVMPASFHSNEPVDVWTPVRPCARCEGGGENYTIIARLKDGVSWPEADGQV